MPYLQKRLLIRVFLLLLLTLCAVGWLVRPVLARQTPKELVQQGNRHWDEKSYSLAEEAYRKALAADPKLPERPELELRIAIVLLREREWDSAVSAMEDYVKAYRNTLWEARAQIWRGRLYATVSHNGYRVGKKIVRGNDVPKSEGKETPKRLDLRAEDSAKQFEAFYRAKQLMDRFRSARLAPEERRSLTADEIELNFDLANLSRTMRDSGRFDGASVDWDLNPTEPFDPRWPSPKQTMYLYQQIIALDSAQPGSNRHQTVLARLAEAAFILDLRQQMTWNPFAYVGRRWVRVPWVTIPYIVTDPIQLLEETLKRYPNDPEADQIAFTIANWIEQKGDLPGALNAYSDFLTRYPNSRWAVIARRRMDVLLQPGMSLETPLATQPGKPLVLTLKTHNISLVHFTAYRIHPETIFGHVAAKPEDPAYHPPFENIRDYFTVPEVVAAYHKEKVVEWTATTSNNGKHNFAENMVTTPLDTLGAYIIEAHPEGHDEIRSTTLALVSDMTLVQKVDKDSVLVYTADALTGKPLPEVKLTLWEPVHIYEGGEARDAVYTAGTTDASGIFHAKLPTPFHEENHGWMRRVCEVFACAGGNRYALTNPTNYDTNDEGVPIASGERAFRAYITTDRPLYRPNQEVHYRVVMTQGLPGRYHPAANKTIAILLSGPRGELLRKEVTLSAFGSYNDTFPLPNDAALGDYTVSAETPKAVMAPDTFDYGDTRFRVEEYKKPEFTVTVTPEKAQVRVGEKLKVTVAARYFFGVPVANAMVHYKVLRVPYLHVPPFPPRLAWYRPTDDLNPDPYSNLGRRRDYSYWGAPDTAYREGDVTTNAQGEAQIEFPTDPPRTPRGSKSNPAADADQYFSIGVTVTDDTRRQVTGSGTARANALQFHAWMHTDRHFLLLGDALKLEVRTRDGNDRPFGAEGQITLWRQIPEVPEQRVKDPKTGKERILVKYVPPREERDGVLIATTDAAQEGNSLVYWHPEIAAEYRLEYTAKDAWGHEIQTSLHTLVYGPNFDNHIYDEDSRFEMRPEYGDYHVGDTARLLLVTPKRDCYVLFTEQAIGGIQRYRTIFVPGRSAIITVPIHDDYIPNAQFVATVVWDGRVSETEASVGVPAEDRIFALTVTPDKAQYKPGEHATFKIHAVGADGKPVRGEVNLGIVDEALLAMQPDRTPDIRAFFYGFRIPSSVPQSDSTSTMLEQILVAPAIPSRERQELPFPEGVGWPGDDRPMRTWMPDYLPYLPSTARKSPGGFGQAGSGGMAGGPPSGRDVIALSDDNSIVVRVPDTAEGEQAFRELQSQRGQAAASGINNFQPIARADPSSQKESNGFTPDQSGVLGSLVDATVRRRFADTAYWMPAVVTDGNGDASVSFDYPDNITQWHFTARGVTSDIQVGTVQGQSLTKKNLIVRLQAPRFFVDHDQVTLSANLHNYLQTAKTARVQLVVDADTFTLAANASTPGGQQDRGLVRTVSVEKDGEVRLDWTVEVKRAGTTKIKVIAQTDEESDAAELAFPVLVHGVEKFLANSGILHNGGETTLTLDLPEMRRKGASLLDVQLSPSLASVLLDALPYLQDYPYGCVEQTLDRFVPTVTVAKTLKDAGLDLETIGKRAQELEKQRAAIPLEQQIANSGYTYPKGVPGALDTREMASHLFLHARSHDPIFSSTALKAMTDQGLQRLYDMQRPDGSWGWWQGSTVGDPYLTAYALEGLLTARQSDIAVKVEVVDNAEEYLTSHLKATEDLHLLAYFVYVLSLDTAAHPIAPDSEPFRMAEDFLFSRRDRMTPNGQALLALALHNLKRTEKAQVLLRNLETLAKRDNERGSVHWESEDRFYWHWYNDKQETTARVLQALVAIAPAEQLAPVNGPQAAQTGLAPLAVRWLVDNRRGGHWTSTRQTALVVSALLAYAKAQKELTPDFTVTLDLDGKVQKSYTITRENALFFDNRFLVGDEILASGAQKLHLTMSGTGTLYWNAYLKYFDMSEPIQGVSNAISVERKYYKLVSTLKRDRQGQSVTSTERVPLSDGANLVSGDIVEVELYLKSDNDYEYVVFEDMKPAGCEAVETRSGEAYGDGLCSNFELRDEKVAFFVDLLPQGTRRITYKLRAEVPGKFHALPTNGYAMYTPDIRALSDEWRVHIVDAPPITALAEKGKRK